MVRRCHNAMRTEIVIAVLVLTFGLILPVFLILEYVAMETVREFVKQIAVWLGIMTLLPMSVWYGTSAFSPPPDWKEHARTTARLDERIKEAKDGTEKEKLRAEKDQLVAELQEAERV